MNEMMYYGITRKTELTESASKGWFSNMNALEAVIWIVVIAVVIAAVVLLRKQRGGDKRYDERQMTLRAAGYRLAFFVTLAAGVVVLFLAEMEILPAAAFTLALFVALMAGIVTFAVFCIIHEVFFSIGDKGNYYRVLFGVIVLIDGFAAGTRIADGTILENGVPTFAGCSSLVMTLVFLVVFVALLVPKNGEEDDDE